MLSSANTGGQRYPSSFARSRSSLAVRRSVPVVVAYNEPRYSDVLLVNMLVLTQTLREGFGFSIDPVSVIDCQQAPKESQGEQLLQYILMLCLLSRSLGHRQPGYTLWMIAEDMYLHIWRQKICIFGKKLATITRSDM